MSDVSDEADDPAFHVEQLTPEGGVPSSSPSADSADDYQTLAHGFLSPRHRRLAQLSAEGLSNAVIAEQLGYSGSRVSILLRNPYVAEEIVRLQEKIFEETVQQRLKSFAEPALNNIHMILTDRTNRVKVSEKAEMSKWVVEKLDGKAAQKVDIGENMLSVFLDRLDSQKTARAVGPPGQPDIETVALPPAPSEAEGPKDELTEWVREFCGES